MMSRMVPKKPTAKAMSFRLTEEARKLLALLAEKRGVNMTAYLETLIRDEAERKNVDTLQKP